MSRLSCWIVEHASWRFVLGTFVLAGALIALMNGVLIPAISVATGGLDPFDIIFPLSTEDIVAGLEQYNADAFKAYLVFIAIDIAFPITSGLFSACLGAWLIKLSGFTWLISAANRGGILLAFVPTFFDLLENVGFVILIASLPEKNLDLISATAFVHAAKFQTINLLSIALGLLILLALAGLIMRWRRPRKQT